MANQQGKRRRKRYRAGSAYAGDVKPTGVLGALSSRRTMTVVFIAMALALAAGGAASLFAGDLFRGGSTNPSGFVLPPDSDGTPSANPTVALRQYTSAPAMTIDVGTKYTATIRTDQGDIEIELLPTQAPETVNNFVFLARDGFYNGLSFHRVVEDFVAQAGDPACAEVGGACRGSGGPGYELSEQVEGEYAAGTLGMANGSQFFIALTGSDDFSAFTPFGRVVSGLDVAERLTIGTQIEAIEIQEG